MLYKLFRKKYENDEVFHDETGYWMWDKEAGIIMHALTISRGVCILAGGIHKDGINTGSATVLEVSTSVEDDK